MSIPLWGLWSDPSSYYTRWKTPSRPARTDTPNRKPVRRVASVNIFAELFYTGVRRFVVYQRPRNYQQQRDDYQAVKKSDFINLFYVKLYIVVI
jgi:hypothetical protein